MLAYEEDARAATATEGATEDTLRRERVLTRLATAAAPRGFRMAMDLLRDRAEAEDAVQEALARACASCERIRDPGAIDAWFYRVLTHLCLRTLRRRRLRRLILGPGPGSGSGGEGAAEVPLRAGAEVADVPCAAPRPAERADDTLARRQEVARMLDLLDGLPAMQRVALVLRYGHDRSIAEIAAMLDVKPATVKTHLVRGLRRLRTSMERPS